VKAFVRGVVSKVESDLLAIICKNLDYFTGEIHECPFFDIFDEGKPLIGF
jgi:hypothetical protein